jgi:tetratricopeptide (TPR) repeat protein
LWSHAAAVTRNNAGAENVLGETLKRDGDPDGAAVHFRAAEHMDPLFPYPYYHIGIYDEQHENLPAALEQFKKVIELTNNDSGLLSTLRLSTLVRMYSDYATLGDRADSEKCMTMAVQLDQQQQQRAVKANPVP